jgi:hypothetical protein
MGADYYLDAPRRNEEALIERNHMLEALCIRLVAAGRRDLIDCDDLLKEWWDEIERKEGKR